MPEKSRFEILLEPFGLRFTAGPGANLSSFLREHGVSLRSDCGGKGVCGKCVVNGSVRGQSSAPPEQVLACSTAIHSDIRALQLAKGALSTGISMLCSFAGCSLPEQILLAGSFGSHVAVEDLFTIGLLPPISREKVQIVGNA
ncbi:MAG: ASKHA domain-containing protein, partial [Syntrophobacteraceae bacterium]